MLQIAHNFDSKERTNDVKISENVDFSAMLLSERILNGLTKNGFKKPSPIQLKAIPMGLCGFDLVMKAKSGTGKTAVFGIIALETVDVNKNELQTLILAPTREIAVQIQQVLLAIGCEITGLKVEYFIGGTPVKNDKDKLKMCHIAVGAPGRMKHLIKTNAMNVNHVRLFILDEADKLVQSSYQSDINYIYNKLSDRKQMIASSATYPNELDSFISRYMNAPTHVTPDEKKSVLLGLKQFVSIVNSHLNVTQQLSLKTNELLRILQTVSFTQCLIFSNYQTRAECLSNNLTRLGWSSLYISGAQTQKTRLETVTSLKQFKCRILSSTDLTARGIDAANVDLVINYEVPNDTETYLHRMGRAGRYGSSGLCISIVSDGAELEKFKTIVNDVGSKELFIYKFPKTIEPGFDIWNNCDENNLEKLSIPNPDSTVTEQLLEQSKEIDSNFVESVTTMLQNLNESSNNKKIKSDESQSETEINSEDINTRFDSEAEIFQQQQQQNTVLNKNIALYNLTRLLIEPDELPNETNVNSVSDLLSIIEQNDESLIDRNETKSCGCSEELFTKAFSFTQSEMNEHWSNCLCDLHKKIEDDEEEFETEEMEGSEFEDMEEVEEEYCEEIENPVTSIKYDEDIFVKAYDYALKSNENPKQVSSEEEYDDQAQGYASGYDYQSCELNSEQNSAADYNAQYEYYNNILLECGPHFTDVSSFEKWFKEWQENVYAVRNFVLQDVFSKEILGHNTDL